MHSLRTGDAAGRGADRGAQAGVSAAHMPGPGRNAAEHHAAEART